MDVESHLHSSKSISIILTFLLAFFNDCSHMCQTRTPIPLNQLLLNILRDNEPINRTPWKHFQCSEVKDFTSVHHNCIKNNSWICFSSSLSSFGKHSSFSLTWQNAQVLRPYFTEENQKCTVSCLICAYASIYVQLQYRTPKIKHRWWWWDRIVWFGILFVVRWLKCPFLPVSPSPTVYWFNHSEGFEGWIQILHEEAV